MSDHTRAASTSAHHLAGVREGTRGAASLGGGLGGGASAVLGLRSTRIGGNLEPLDEEDEFDEKDVLLPDLSVLFKDKFICKYRQL